MFRYSAVLPSTSFLIIVSSSSALLVEKRRCAFN